MDIKIKIQLENQEIELNYNEVKELYNKLKKICGDDEIIYHTTPCISIKEDWVIPEITFKSQEEHK